MNTNYGATPTHVVLLKLQRAMTSGTELLPNPPPILRIVNREGAVIVDSQSRIETFHLDPIRMKALQMFEYHLRFRLEFYIFHGGGAATASTATSRIG